MPPKQGRKSATSLFEINSGGGRKGAGDRQPDRREGKGRDEMVGVVAGGRVFVKKRNQTSGKKTKI